MYSRFKIALLENVKVAQETNVVYKKVIVIIHISRHENVCLNYYLLVSSWK